MSELNETTENSDLNTKNAQNQQNEKTSQMIFHKSEWRILFIELYVFFGLGLALFYTAKMNPQIFTLHPETLSLITEAYNLMVLLLIPMFFDAIGAISRVMLSGLNIAKNFRLIISSSLMAAFSWLSIKSKIFISLIAPHIITSNATIQPVSDTLEKSSPEIYSMVLVAVIVGMFASNLYIFINNKVEKITEKSRN